MISEVPASSCDYDFHLENKRLPRSCSTPRQTCAIPASTTQTEIVLDIEYKNFIEFYRATRKYQTLTKLPYIVDNEAA